MEIVRDQLGNDILALYVQGQVRPKSAVGVLRVEVAEVWREKRLAAARDAERALELGARADDGLPGHDRKRQG